MAPPVKMMKMRNPYAASNVQRGGGEPFIANPNVLDSLGQSSVEISERETSKSLEWTKESECSFSASISAQSKQKKQFSEQQPAVDAASIVASKKPYGVSHPLQTNATSSTQHIVGARKSTDDTLGNTATNNPLMTQLLPQLRIFQREALEFAVDGKHYERQFMAPNAELLRTDDGGSIGKQSSVRISAADSRSNSSIISNTYDCFPVGQGRILLADEMGLGKTVTSLAIMTCYQAEWPLLILCPASLKYTWPAEIEKFLPSMPASAVYVVAGFQDLGFLIASGMDVKKGIQVVVVSYSLFQRRSAVSHAITADMFHCIIADESHNLKCKDSQRSDILLPLLTRSKRLILLSGTPALSRPAELWTQLHALRPSAFGTWKDFAARYCNPTKKHIGQGRYMMDYTGSSNEGELHAKLKHVMVRRLKSSVLAELPSKQRTVIPVTMSAHELVKCKQAMADLKEKWTASCSLEQLVVTDNSSNFEAKTALVKAFQQTGIGKAASIADYLTTVWLPGCSDSNKILVFAHHSAVLDTIEQALWKGVSSRSPKQHIRIDGSVPAANRTQLVRQFQTCSGIRVALLSMTAAGVGLTLTAASTVLFAELHWTPGVLAQAEDRAHRIGQTADAVQILYMVNRDPSQSVDMTLWKMLGKKIHTLDQIVDGKQELPYLFLAQEGENAPQGKSVQEELTDFFAATTTNAQQPKNSSPVKGSIQSFFRKAAATAAAKTSCKKSDAINRSSVGSTKAKEMIAAVAALTKAPSQVETAARYAFDEGDGSATICVDLAAEGIPPVQQLTSDEALVFWTCKACTLKNSRNQNRSDWYQCEVCGEPHWPGDVVNSYAMLDECSSEAVVSRMSLLNRKQPVSVDMTKGSNLCFTQPLSGRAKRARVSISPLASSIYKGSSDVIVLDDDDNNDDASPSEMSEISSNSLSQRKPNATEVIVLDEDDGKYDENHGQFSSSRTSSERPSAAASVPYERSHTLSFSVSKNTSRMTIHFADESDKSTQVNFDLQDVMTDDAVDLMLDAKVNHASGPRQSLAIDFNESRINHVLEKVYQQNEDRRNWHDFFRGDIKAFVSNYHGLREVEKKALKDSGQAFSPSSLSHAAAKLMSRSLSSGRDRYVGGAKERAQQNEGKGCATDVDQLVLNGRACAWCSQKLASASLSGQATYCSEECAVEGRLRRGGKFASANIRATIFALEGGKCCLCGIDAHALFEQISVLRPAERLNRLLAVNWKLPKSSKAMESLLQYPKEGNFWQVDHIQAVSEGGGGCGLENLRTLCVPCHLLETGKLRGRLLLQTHETSANTRWQAGVRSAFSAAGMRCGRNGSRKLNSEASTI